MLTILQARLKGLGLLIILIAALTVFASPAKAIAEEGKTVGQGLQISPVLVDLNATKGGVYNLKLTVTNVTEGDLAVKSEANDFKAAGENGDPKILDDESNDNYSFRRWASPIPSFTLRAKESRQIMATISVPSAAEAGGHYGVLRFSGMPPELAGQNVALKASVGVLVLTRVEGNITENMSIKSFFAETPDGKQTNLLSGSGRLVERFENSGNIHLKPSGTVTVKNMFGSVVMQTDINKPPKNVLPSSIRRFSHDLPKHLWPGRYTADLVVTYGTGDKTLASSMSFWVIPYKSMAIVLGGLVLLIIGGRLLIKRYNARVIRKHSKRSR